MILKIWKHHGLFTDPMFSHSPGTILSLAVVSELMLLFIPWICVSVSCGKKAGEKYCHLGLLLPSEEKLTCKMTTIGSWILKDPPLFRKVQNSKDKTVQWIVSLLFYIGNFFFVRRSQCFYSINLQELINVKCSSQPLCNISNNMVKLGVTLWEWNQGYQNQ